MDDDGDAVDDAEDVCYTDVAAAIVVFPEFVAYEEDDDVDWVFAADCDVRAIVHDDQDVQHDVLVAGGACYDVGGDDELQQGDGVPENTAAVVAAVADDDVEQPSNHRRSLVLAAVVAYDNCF